MALYCQEKSEAKVNFTDLNGLKDSILVKSCPVEILCNFQEIIYNHLMNSPINKVFDGTVVKAELVDPFQKFSIAPAGIAGYTESSRFLLCPDVNRAARSDNLHVEGNRIYSYFDAGGEGIGADFYADNEGVCTYRVFVSSQPFTILDLRKNVIYSNPNVINYTVSCDDECPPGYCKCECTNYPGYCCYDKNGNPL